MEVAAVVDAGIADRVAGFAKLERVGRD